MPRPSGSMNKTQLARTFEGMFEKIEYMLNPKQRDYLQKVFKGQEEFDAIKLGEPLMMLFMLYSTNILNSAIEENVVSQDVAQTIAQCRMGLKDMEDMRVRRDKDKSKDSDNGVVDPTRQPEVAGIEGILAGIRQE